MSGQIQPRPPGSHPHADQLNWRPADNPWDYLRNCYEGLEPYSNRRLAKLFDISRAELWRWQLMAELPDDLFEMLLKAPRRQSSKSLAAVAVALKNGAPAGEVERCPHCGWTLRVRPSVSRENIKIVVEWMNKREAAGRAQ
jgi:hypothetical protein